MFVIFIYINKLWQALGHFYLNDTLLLFPWLIIGSGYSLGGIIESCIVHIS